jgi:hypothetical protein
VAISAAATIRGYLRESLHRTKTGKDYEKLFPRAANNDQQSFKIQSS